MKTYCKGLVVSDTAKIENSIDDYFHNKYKKNSTVAPLYEYDEMNHSDLVRVLQCYLANDCSVKSASQELIVHRNTINYKLGKAAEILGKNLSDFDVRFQLRLGFLLYQMNEM